MQIPVRKIKEDRGLCRTYYMTHAREMFCRMPDYTGVMQWWQCSKDGEPEYVVPYDFTILEVKNVRK